MNFYFNNNKQIFYRNKDSLISNSRFFVSLTEVSRSLEFVGVNCNHLVETVSTLNLRQLSGLQFCRFF